MKTAPLSILLLWGLATPQIVADDAANEKNDDEMPTDTIDDDTIEDLSSLTDLDYGNATFSNDTFFNETNVTFAPTPAPLPCDILLDYVHEEIYSDDFTIQNSSTVRPGESACSCLQSSLDGQYFVTCPLFYCEECNDDDVCLSRIDRYIFGSSPNLTFPEVAAYQQNLDFDPILEQTDEDGVLYNWTGVTIGIVGDECTAVVLENYAPFEDDESGICACEYVECKDGATQLAFDCNGRRWGYCTEEENTFDPNTLAEGDPLMAINPDKYSWASCFDDPTLIMEEDVGLVNATNGTNVTMVEDEDEDEEEVDTAIEKNGPSSRVKPKGGSEPNGKPEGTDHVGGLADVDDSEPLPDMFSSSWSLMRSGPVLVTLMLATGVLL